MSAWRAVPYLGPVAVAFAGVVAVAGFAVWSIESADRVAEARVEALAAAYDAATLDVDVPTAEEIVDGGAPPPTPAELAPVPPVGPTPEQVAAAVAASCADGACSAPVTPAQVQAAVASFCAGGACTPPPPVPGADGAPGSAGADGEPGSDGEPGAPASPADIAAAAAAFCSTGACTGPAGAAGTPGPAPTSFSFPDGQVCTDPDGDLAYSCTGGGLLGGVIP